MPLIGSELEPAAMSNPVPRPSLSSSLKTEFDPMPLHSELVTSLSNKSSIQPSEPEGQLDLMPLQSVGHFLVQQIFDSAFHVDIVGRVWSFSRLLTRTSYKKWKIVAVQSYRSQTTSNLIFAFKIFRDVAFKTRGGRVFSKQGRIDRDINDMTWKTCSHRKQKA